MKYTVFAVLVLLLLQACKPKCYDCEAKSVIEVITYPNSFPDTSYITTFKVCGSQKKMWDDMIFETKTSFYDSATHRNYTLCKTTTVTCYKIDN